MKQLMENFIFFVVLTRHFIAGHFSKSDKICKKIKLILLNIFRFLGKTQKYADNIPQT